ncbi:MAG: YidC/Oxa1 family membrane protein insertase, partial [Clostridia bacterium]|nr:YidC/Oxa1 family membrane protein insertase [Clostridia bacterium]
QQSEGYSPLSGCLPLLIQLPLIIILYQIILRPLTYICQIGEETLTAIKNVLTPLAEGTDFSRIGEIDLVRLVREHSAAVAAGEGIGQTVVDKISSMNLSLFGLNLTDVPSLKAMSWLVLIPVLTFATSVISMKLSRKWMGSANMQAATPDSKTSNIIMDYMMPAMSLYIAFTVPAAVGLYWIYQTVLGMGQQYLLSVIMPLPTFTPEEIREMERAEKERERERRAAAMQSKKSRFDDDDDDGDVPPPVHSKYGDDD